jgi:hypothetical protein
MTFLFRTRSAFNSNSLTELSREKIKIEPEKLARNIGHNIDREDNESDEEGVEVRLHISLCFSESLVISLSLFFTY